MTQRTLYAAGNWKMNGVSGDLSQVAGIADAARAHGSVKTVLCLPATLIDRARNLGLDVGGQDCHSGASGAHTGDISPDMLVDAGAGYAIVGHSERRVDHREADATVAAKAQAAWAAGLVSIICIGETEAHYRAGETLDVLRRQINGSVPDDATCETSIIAYEPVWAIGTGLTPSTNEIQETHAAIRAALPDEDISILYGGSIKPGNASEIFSLGDVDGGLVGGASLKAADFVPIIQALASTKGGA